MKIISIVNHKGGVGKSTISTNLAGYYANHTDKNILLGDFDVQQSSRNWLQTRPTSVEPIKLWQIKNGRPVAPDPKTDVIIIDTPAGIRGDLLKKVTMLSHKIIVPIKPGAFDILSSSSFLKEIFGIITDAKSPVELCLVGNMVDLRTKATEQLLKFLRSTVIECPALLKTTQRYAILAGHGLSVFDYKTTAFEKEVQQWNPLIEWLGEEPVALRTKVSEDILVDPEDTVEDIRKDEQPFHSK